MAVDLTTLLPEKNRVAQPAPFLWLIFCRVPTDPPTAIRITPNPEPVTFGTDSFGNPTVWSPFPCGLSVIEEDTEGNLPELTLTVSNATREIMALLIAHDYLLDQRVELYLVHKNHLANPAAASRFVFTITEVTADTEAVTFALSTQDLYRYEIPGNRILKDWCGETYKGSRCGFTGDPSETLGPCLKTLAECRRRDAWQVANGEEGRQSKRYGAWPSLPVL